MKSICSHPAFVAAALGITLSSVRAGTIQQPSGFYVMQAVHQANVSDSVLADPRLSGIHLRDAWSLLEPTATTNSYGWLDEQIARAKSRNKQVTLGIYSGTKSPTWLGAPLISGAPLPWDTRVTTAFSAMVAELGAHYHNEPAISAVHISSPATNNSMEMFLPDGLTTTTGYTDQKIIDVWKSAINTYAIAFPDKALVLDIAMVPDVNGAITDAVAAYAMLALGPRINFIHCSLKASTDPLAPHHETVAQLHAAGARIGFEMACPSIDTTRFGGTFVDALAIGEAACASWYQIYQADVPSIPANFFGIPGDYNHDGHVNAGDYVVWRRSMGTGSSNADGNQNGTVDSSDYDIWRNYFGMIGYSERSAIEVPEPTEALAAALAFVLCLVLQRAKFQPVVLANWIACVGR